VGWVIIGVLPAECLCDRKRFAVLSDQRQGGHQRELRTAAAGIAFERFVKQPYRRLGAPEQQLGKSGVKKEDAVPSLCRIEAHGPRDGLRCLPGAAEKHGIVAGVTMGDRQCVTACNRIR
jgi:hypothetical protein